MKHHGDVKVSEGLNSVETPSPSLSMMQCNRVSEGLNSVETFLHQPVLKRMRKFQKDLIVWKLHRHGKSIN